MVAYEYLNKVRFSMRRSRELRVMQSWSNTNGYDEADRNTINKINNMIAQNLLIKDHLKCKIPPSARRSDTTV